MEEITFTWMQWGEPSVQDCLALRKAVFVTEQGFALEDELDAQDATALHLLGSDADGRALCTARMFEEKPGLWHAGRIAVCQSLRGQGIGRQLMAEVARKVAALGGTTLELGAQYDKAPFYEAVGFTRFGELYQDAGYPHIGMRRTL
jgi:predicted GNAT family N-acyltransferase